MSGFLKKGDTIMRMHILRLGVLLFTAVTAAGCGDLFTVENPGSLTVADLDDPNLIPALAATPEGVVCDAWDGTVAANALQSDDVTFISSFTFTELHMWGHMEGFNTTQNAVWNSMSSARWIAAEALRRLQESNPGDTTIVRGVYWEAFARIGMADHFKEVPFNGEAPLAPDVVLEQTLPALDQVAQTSNPDLRAAALATKARVHRSLYFERGRDASQMAAAMQAAEAALAVKSDFYFACRYQDPGSLNGLSTYHQSITGVIIDPRNVAIEDPVSGEVDPRVGDRVGPPELAAPPPHTGDVHRYFKYPGLDADLPASRWQEARLILAEAQLLAGNLQEAVDQINLVRAEWDLPEFSSMDGDAIREQLIYERRLEFMVEGRRLQDHRYYDIKPWQWDEVTKQLGTNRRWPVSSEEIAGNSHYQSGS